MLIDAQYEIGTLSENIIRQKNKNIFGNKNKIIKKYISTSNGNVIAKNKHNRIADRSGNRNLTEILLLK